METTITYDRSKSLSYSTLGYTLYAVTCITPSRSYCLPLSLRRSASSCDALLRSDAYIWKDGEDGEDAHEWRLTTQEPGT